ncbi:hypothetical protein PybrP1_001689 [[Pythium] brassicae (nom. inval.)]|nr:hypothetical protein PybrP1_001689 [[Pythium] brassicae (nom. inval.)]
MNDPFAMFDPMGNRSKPNSAVGYSTMPMNYGQPGGLPPPQQQHQQQQINPFGAPVGPMQQQANLYGGMMPPGNSSHHPQYPSPNNFGGSGGGSAFMTQPGPVASFSGLTPAPQLHQMQPMPMTGNPYMQAPQQQQQQQHFATTQPNNGGSNPFGDGGTNMLAAQQDPFGAQMKSMGGVFAQTPQHVRPPEPTSAMTMPPAPLRQSPSIIVDFDPFSPRENTPRSPFDFPDTQASSSNGSARDLGSSSDFADRKRQTQEAQRSQLGFSSDAFSGATGGSGSVPKISLKDVGVQQQQQSRSANNVNATRTQQSRSLDDSPFFSDNDEAFADHHMFANVDDESAGKNEWGQLAKKNKAGGDADAEDAVPDECGPNEYDVTFESGRKLGVLMERVDIWTKREDKRQEVAVVKLVVENGAADRVGVSTGSSVVAINGHSVARDSYTVVLEMIKGAPRPMTVRFKRGTVNKDTTQGSVLTRISNGTFSVGNLTKGNANWTDKYFAFGGAKMDVLQLFVSRAAYHECVISLYEKRPVHTQIQSFRLCRDHKITPIKSKIYKGYGNLHYFSLSVPSLRFIAAKFASEDYETLKNLWSNTYDAIERKKRMGY